MAKKAAKPAGFTVTAGADMVELGIRNVIADSLDIDVARVSVIRITRKKGGGVEADLKVMPLVTAE